MMNNLYHIYREEAHPELLPVSTLEALDNRRDKLYAEYHDNVMRPAMQNWSVERDSLLDKYARLAGFDNYEHASNCRWDRKLMYQGDNIVKLREFDKYMNSDEYRRLYQKKDTISRADSDYFNSLSQDYLYEILKLTRPMMETVDSKGKPILPPDQWLKNNPSGKLQVSGVQNPSEGVLPFVDSLNQAGYRIRQACSGMVGDNPDERYLSDDPAGNYKAGEHKYWGTQASTTYIQFLSKDVDTDMLAEFVSGAGFLMSTSKNDDRTLVTLELPATRDGLSQKELENEFLQHIKDKGLSVPTGHVEMNEITGKYPALYRQVVASHGGWAIYSDEMLKSRLSNLTYQLVQNAYRILDTEMDAQVRSEEPVEEKVDFGQLFAKYISLVEKAYGKEKAENTVKEILNETVKLEHLLESAVVLLDTRRGKSQIWDYSEAKAEGALNNDRYVNVRERVSDVNVCRYVGSESRYYLRCKIDGAQQMNVSLNEEQADYWKNMLRFDSEKRELAKLRLAGDVHAGILTRTSLEQSESKGIRR